LFLFQLYCTDNTLRPSMLGPVFELVDSRHHESSGRWTESTVLFWVGVAESSTE